MDYVHDLRPQLTVVDADSRRKRRKPVIGATLHYNGPPLSFVPDPERELEFVRTVDVKTHQRRLHADSLQYHFVVLSDGSVYQTRDLDLIAWHCGNVIGNEQSLAVHLPIGKDQHPTERQWAATERLFDDLWQRFHFSRTDVVGHNEWPRHIGMPKPSASYRVLPGQSQCPGRILHQLLVRYRTSVPTERWRAKWLVPIRRDPRVTYPDGRDVPIVGWLNKGDTFDVVAVRSDDGTQIVRGDGRWLELAHGRGFTWLPNAEKCTQ